MRALVLLAALPWMAPAQPARRAAERALPALERSAGSFVAQRACVSCHHNILPVVALHLARERGLAIDPGILRAVEDKTFRSLDSPAALEDAIQAATLNDPTPNDSFLLMAAGAAGRAPDLITGIYARRLARWQRDGHWVTSDFRPPHSSSAFTATATAVRAIRLYMPEELRSEADACIGRARHWLLSAHPLSTEDAAFRLLGLVWAGAPHDEVAAARRDLLAMQQPAGGWPQLASYPGDAYSTGESLFALNAAGTPPEDARWKRGEQFLISTQGADGTWRVRTRMLSPADVSPKYFSTGFPYGKDEYLSYAGTCWAVMALLSPLPETVARPEPAGAAADAAPWVRTVLFGAPRELEALLDFGLDPNSRTAAGTTLLMMAAPDAEKAGLLLAHGAKAGDRSLAGYDALTIAASYRGAAASLRLLLDAGAEVQPPKGAHARRSALVTASMTGDLESVKLLLSRGADPQAGTPLATAATFGYADVVEALLAAGATATLTEGSGVNLLHWAAIANRPAVIPLLAQAGAHINAADDSGFTPLMYAATIDFGDTECIQALLKAGADRSIRNQDGRTALEQARHYRLARLAAALQ